MNNNVNENECIICLDNYDIDIDNLVFFTPDCGCRVTTHFDCAQLWIEKEMKCPICASNIKITDMFSNKKSLFIDTDLNNHENNFDLNNQQITTTNNYINYENNNLDNDTDNNIILNISSPYNSIDNSSICDNRKKTLLLFLFFILFIFIFIIIITSQ